MKKLYILLFTFLIASLSFGQELLLNGDFEAWDNTTSPTSWTKAESTEQEATEIHGGTYSAKHTGGTSDISQTITGIIPGNDYTVTVWYKVDAGFQDGTDARIWSKWSNNGTLDHTTDAAVLQGVGPGGYFDNNGNIWTEYSVTVTAPATANEFYFEIRTYSGAIVYWDDFSFFAEAPSLDPSLFINSPTEGSTLLVDNTDVTFLVQNFDVANGTGDGHIHYTVDGGGTVMKYDTDPISLTGLSDGAHTVYMELVDNSHVAITPAVNATVNFTINNITQTLPVSESFSYADGSLDGNGWLSFGGTDGDLLVSSGQAVLQMGGGSEDISLVFTSVSGSLYYGLDFSVDDLGAPYTGTDNEYFAHFKTDGFDYSARLDVVAPTSTGDFSVGISTDQGTADLVWATDLTYGTTYRVIVKYDQDTNQTQLWIDASVEGDTSILGLDQPDPGDSVSQFALRQSGSSESETIRVDNLSIGTTFGAVTLGTNDFETNNFKIYPNPTNTGYVNISSLNSEVLNAKVFDVLGKEVLDSRVENNQLNVSNLNAGMYILKLSQNNATVTKKLIIQ